jgi:hypothetical protein
MGTQNQQMSVVVNEVEDPSVAWNFNIFKAIR